MGWIGIVASILLVLSSGSAKAQLTAGSSVGLAAQKRSAPFAGLHAPTPRIPPPAAGRAGSSLHQSFPGQASEEEPEASPVPGMVVGATVGSLVGTATGICSVIAACRDCDYGALFAALAAGWVGGTTGSAIGMWAARSEDGVTGGDAVLASLAGRGVGLAAGLGWGFPIAQGITTAVVAELLRE